MPKLNPHQSTEVPTKLITLVNRQVFIINETENTIILEATDTQDALRPKLTIKVSNPQKET